MVMKDEISELSVTTLLAPISVNASADWTKVDTKGYEGALIVVDLGALAADIDWVLSLMETDTSAATAGSAVTAHFGWGTSDNSATVNAKFSAAGVCTLNAAADGGRKLIWEYTGASRYVGVSVVSAGSKAGVVGVTAIRSHGRRMPLHTMTRVL